MTDHEDSKKVDNNRRVILAALAGGALTGASVFSGREAHAAVSETTTAEQSLSSTVDLNKKGMQLIITGSGSALPDPLRGGASCAVVIDGVVLQFDCGRRVLENLMLVGINPMKVDHLFFTHMHFDHIADYDYFVISNWIAGRQEMVNVYGPTGTERMSEGAIRHMHAMDYDFVHEILSYWPPHMSKRPTQEPPFKAQNISPGVVIETDKFKVSCLETDHLPFPNMSSLGYRIDSDYGSVAISGDTAISDGMRTLAKDVDILVHECVKPDMGMTPGGKFSMKDFHSDKLMKKRPQTGHTSPSQLGLLAKEAKVKKLIAYHLAPYTSVPAAIEMSSLYLGPSPGPSIWAEFSSAMKKNYNGPVVLAEDRMIFDVQK
jgi:ribonuclease Z